MVSAELVLTGDKKVALDSLMQVIQSSPDFRYVRFITLYGSVAEGTHDKSSDIDIAVSSDLGDIDAEKFRLFILGRVSDTIDLHIFEHLPLYIRMPVLKGIVLYCRDEDELYDIAYKTIQEWGFFKPHLDDYIGERMPG